MAAGDKLGKITLETSYTTSGVEKVTSDVKEYTNVVINNLQKLRDFVGSKDTARDSTVRLESTLKNIESLLLRRLEIERTIAAQQQAAGSGIDEQTSKMLAFARAASQVLTVMSFTRSFGQQLGSLVSMFTTLIKTLGTKIAAAAGVLLLFYETLKKMTELADRYDRIMVSVRRVTYMLYSSTAGAKNEFRQAIADAIKFGMTLEEVLSYKERLARLASLTEEINFAQFTEIALKMSLATGRSAEEIAANVARVLGMLRSGSGSARALVSLGLSGREINEILDLAKSGGSSGREAAIDLFIKTLTKRFKDVNEKEFITPKQQYESQRDVVRQSTGEWFEGINDVVYKIKSFVLSIYAYYALSRETFNAMHGALDETPPTRPQDTDITDYAVGQAWKLGLMADIDPTGRLLTSYNFNQLMSTDDISAINEVYYARIKAIEKSLYLEASKKSIMDSENLVLLAQIRYADMLAEAQRNGNADLEEKISKERVYFNLQAEYLSKVSQPMESVLKRGLFGVDETIIGEYYRVLNETSDPKIYRHLIYYYEQAIYAQQVQGELTHEEYLEKLRMVEIMKEQSDLVLTNLQRERQLKKELEEQRRLRAEWEAKLEDFKKGSSREQTIRAMLEEIKLYNEAVGDMGPARARETYNERMFAILQRAGLLDFGGLQRQSTPLPGLFTYGSAEAIREINRIRTFGASRNSIDEMVRNIREQLKLDAQNIDLLEAIKQVLIEMRDKIPGAGK